MNAVVIVAAGRGTRMGGNKLFLEVAGEPVIAHSWRCFAESGLVEEIVLAIPEGEEAHFEEVARRIGSPLPHRLVPGGARRQDSVWNGLCATSERADLVAVHDGARPCLTSRILNDTFAAARRCGAAVAATPVVDTLKRANRNGSIAGTVDRTGLWAVQTPQTVRRQKLLDALRLARESGREVTDEAAACELLGQEVVLVPGESPNPKVTYPSDLPFIEWILSRRGRPPA